MKHLVENVLLFYAALPEHDERILSRAREIFDRGIDNGYLESASEAYGAAAALVALLNAIRGKESISVKLRDAAEREAVVTASMRSLFGEVADLLDAEGIPFVPLKGSDRRIADMARRRSDPMQDVDILIRAGDITPTGELLVRSGFLHLGSFSGAHMNFATDEEFPRCLEIHWDLVNRSSPVQRRLFSPDIGKIWDRCSVMCGRLHLSAEDLLCYTAEHAAKEYFRRPKWTVDISCVLENMLPAMDPPRLREVMGEWGVAAVLGIITHALSSVMPWRSYEALHEAGAHTPGILGRFVAERLFGYSQLYSLRPLCSMAYANSPGEALSVAAGIGERMIRGRRRH